MLQLGRLDPSGQPSTGKGMTSGSGTTMGGNGPTTWFRGSMAMLFARAHYLLLVTNHSGSGPRTRGFTVFTMVSPITMELRTASRAIPQGLFYEDREGNLWVVTEGGVDMFRDTPVVTYSIHEGLTSAGIRSVLASRNGSVWIGNKGAVDIFAQAGTHRC